MSEPPNLFPEFMQDSVLTCPEFPTVHPAYMPCGDLEMPCPSCKGIRAQTSEPGSLSPKQLKQIMKTAPKEPGFMPERKGA